MKTFHIFKQLWYLSILKEVQKDKERKGKETNVPCSKMVFRSDPLGGRLGDMSGVTPWWPFGWYVRSDPLGGRLGDMFSEHASLTVSSLCTKCIFFLSNQSCCLGMHQFRSIYMRFLGHYLLKLFCLLMDPWVLTSDMIYLTRKNTLNVFCIFDKQKSVWIM